MEIKDVIEHCKLGEQLAQSILFDSYYYRMYNLSMRMLSNHHDVEDVLIVSFTKIFRNINRFEYRGENSLNKWMKTIVINESIRFVNSKENINFSEDIYEVERNQNIDIDCIDIDADEIYAIIEIMPTGYRMVFNLFAIEGYSHKEISEMMNITENTSKSQLRKARIHIIEKINQNKENGKAYY